MSMCAEERRENRDRDEHVTRVPISRPENVFRRSAMMCVYQNNKENNDNAPMQRDKLR